MRFFFFKLSALFVLLLPHHCLGQQQTETNAKCQKDLYSTALDLKESALSAVDGINSMMGGEEEKFAATKGWQWLNGNAIAIFCCNQHERQQQQQLFLGEIGGKKVANVLHKFCQQMANGKTVDEAAQNVGQSAMELLGNGQMEQALQQIATEIAKIANLEGGNSGTMMGKLGKFLMHQIGNTFPKDKSALTTSTSPFGIGAMAKRGRRRGRRSANCWKFVAFLLIAMALAAVGTLGLTGVIQLKLPLAAGCLGLAGVSFGIALSACRNRFRCCC